MMGEAFDLLGHLVTGERFEARDDASMECPPPLVQQTAVGHLWVRACLKV